MDTCWVYNPNDPFAILIESTQIFNGILINVFMLKVLGIASILRCESKEEEQKTAHRHNLLVKIYVPCYLAAQALVYGCQLWIFSDNQYTLTSMLSLIIIGNTFKLCMTFSLGAIIFVFAYQLKGTINQLVLQWGNSPP